LTGRPFDFLLFDLIITIFTPCVQACTRSIVV
jgi:hypothetical protein